MFHVKHSRDSPAKPRLYADAAAATFCPKTATRPAAANGFSNIMQRRDNGAAEPPSGETNVSRETFLIDQPVSLPRLGPQENAPPRAFSFSPKKT